MPTLNWIGKEAVVNYHQQVPFHLLKDVPELSCGQPGSGNLIVEGDNLVALKALLPYYAGQVKCIYIDPPYNTGNENWTYNDNVNSPLIRQWLGKVVGSENETLDRHDRWLCMMYPRLSLLRKFLRDDGAIFVSIDDNELINLKVILDEIFSASNFVTLLTWFKRVSPANDAKYFSSDHEYVAVYANNKDKWHPNRLTRSVEQLKNYKNPDNHKRGLWNSATYTCNKSAEERPNLYYGINNPNTGEVIWPKRTAVWKYNAETHQQHVSENRIWWGKDGKSRMPRLKVFLDQVRDVVPRSVLQNDNCGSTQEARTELLSIIENATFTTPKPIRLIKYILQIATDSDSLILDSFTGSGTTGHATLSINKDKGDSRKFILIEMEHNIAREITSERVRKVAQGYTNSKGEQIAGLGGGFRFCELGEPLFDENGKIRNTVSFTDLAHHVYFSETGEPLPVDGKLDSPFLGVHQGAGVYLLYNGILGDKRANGGNILTRSVLTNLPAFQGPKIIYCAGCLLGKDRLQKEQIVVRQTPYEVKIA